MVQKTIYQLLTSINQKGALMYQNVVLKGKACQVIHKSVVLKGRLAFVL